MRRACKSFVLAMGLVLPAMAQAQAYRCTVPSTIPVPHPELPTASEPARVLPIGGYTLAVTWAPEFCFHNARGGSKSTSFECGSGNRFGFALHGLWPDGEGAQWPQYCAATDIVPPAVIRSTLCSTPSAQLIQHEWAKHGTCMGTTPKDYFAGSTGLYAKLRFPDMNSLARRPGLTAGDVAAAIAKANPGIGADMMRVTTNKQGWLDEIWFCLDKARRYARCKADSGGVPASTPIKVARRQS